MRTITDEELVNKKVKFARNVSLISMVLLVAGLISTWATDLVLVSFAIVVAGFIGANIGAHSANRWLKKPRADEVLSKVLRGFDDHYRLYNYVAAVAHVFLTPDGVFTLTVKQQDGAISCLNDKWNWKFNWRRLFFIFSYEALGNPTKEALDEAETFRKALTKVWPGDDVPEVHPVIVFTDQDASLQAENLSVPAVTAKELKEYVRRRRKEIKLTPEQRKELYRIMESAAD